MTLKLSHCIIISLILIVGLVGNLFVWESRLLGWTFGPAYLIFCSLIIGFTLFKYRTTIFKIIYGFFFLSAGISFFGAIIYYFYKLNDLTIAALIICIPLIILPFLRYGNHPETKQDFNPIQINPHLLRTTLLIAAFIFLEIINLRYLLGAGTTEAIRTPWKILPFNFFLNYFAASLVLLWFILKSQKEGLNLILISIHTFLTVSLILFVYKIGYGFDPFIHQATEKIIASQGFILPKPFYYLGQYSLVVLLAKILFMPVEWIDKLILPVFISLILPVTIYFSLKPFNIKNQVPGASLPALLILVLPFTTFIATTPQGLANFCLLIIIFLSLIALRHEFHIFYLWFLAFATLLIHPLAGLPALIFVFFLTLFRFFKKQEGIFEFIRHLLFFTAFILGALAIPLLFLFAILFFKDSTTIFSLETIESSKNILEVIDWNLPVWINHFQPLYDLIYTYGKNIPFILLTIGLIGYGLIKKQLSSSIVYLMAFLAMIINYICMKLFIGFPSLIKYEQNIFSERILEISFYFLIPLFLFALYKFFQKLEKNASHLLKIFFTTFFALILTFSLYYSYPKDDGEDYHIDRGYSVSNSDIAAVHMIAQNAGKEDYIVLSNQMVGAAAIREFGFKKYYGQNFYYSIPTGYPLYQYYLRMVYNTPSRATIAEAANLVNVNLVYFVINQYWTDSKKIIEKTKTTADEWFDIDNGKVWIFKYQL